MVKKRDEEFRVRPSAPKQQGRRFVSRVLQQLGKSAGRSARHLPSPFSSKEGPGTTAGAPGRVGPKQAGQRPGSRLGRGHTAARFAQQGLSAQSRRVAVKSLLVNLRHAGMQSTQRHLRYLLREGVGRDQEPGQAYGADTDHADIAGFEERGREDRHQFRFIVSPEEGAAIGDLRTYTRHLMQRMEADLGTRLDWVAVDHWNTDNPHTHIVLRGKDDSGGDLIIASEYIQHGLRDRAATLATEWLGLRSELEIRRSLDQEVDQERWTSLDRNLREASVDGVVLGVTLQYSGSPGQPAPSGQRERLMGRLQHLQHMGLAQEQGPGIWAVRADVESRLREMGERNDIIRRMQRAMRGQQRELAVYQASDHRPPLIGRVAGRGVADELSGRGYLVIDGLDGKAHYVALGPRMDPFDFALHAVVEVGPTTTGRSVDRNIAAAARDGIYRTDQHQAALEARPARRLGDPDLPPPDQDTAAIVAAHVRRLEALRRAGIVERLAEGVWRVPQDLPDQGHKYDVERHGQASVSIRSHWSIERQVRAVGATWLDQTLIRESAAGPLRSPHSDGQDSAGNSVGISRPSLGQSVGQLVGSSVGPSADHAAEPTTTRSPGSSPLPAPDRLVDRQSERKSERHAETQLFGQPQPMSMGQTGFGAELRHALQQRADFLVEQGWAQRRASSDTQADADAVANAQGQAGRLSLPRNLLAQLRQAELERAGQKIAQATGLLHRPVNDGQLASGIYRRSLMLASGRFAMLDDGVGFSLVPWKPVIEAHLGKHMSATVAGWQTTWKLGVQRGPGL